MPQPTSPPAPTPQHGKGPPHTKWTLQAMPPHVAHRCLPSGPKPSTQVAQPILRRMGPREDTCALSGSRIRASGQRIPCPMYLELGLEWRVWILGGHTPWPYEVFISWGGAGPSVSRAQDRAPLARSQGKTAHISPNPKLKALRHQSVSSFLCLLFHSPKCQKADLDVSVSTLSAALDWLPSSGDQSGPRPTVL